MLPMEDTVDEWLMFSGQRKPAARLQLICFHHAGGGASMFRKWAEELPEEIAVSAVQLPGREFRLREPCFTRMEPLIHELVKRLTPRFDLPFAFFGHSMGALVAFELARELRRRGEREPFYLGVSGRIAPQLRSRFRPAAELTDAQLIERVRELGGLPEQVAREPELLALVLPIIRADYAVIDNYTCTAEPPLSCAISAFWGRGDILATEEQVFAWKQHTHHQFTIRDFPGDHFFVNTVRQDVQRALRADLKQALE
ncbi:thioesterase II family protein [Myxococcus landrumensis]|uniref:Thioesterase n=1 Tax=Myxococcus landrumensis TaxID=2813577 RepID=A0ABX7NAJ6_9BACT|nr:alpha/beta fold hydrolase [Myxococcus landrumus]QSQ15448.1 thioesterase [Myxococcus landrumus]